MRVADDQLRYPGAVARLVHVCSPLRNGVDGVSAGHVRP